MAFIRSSRIAHRAAVASAAAMTCLAVLVAARPAHAQRYVVVYGPPPPPPPPRYYYAYSDDRDPPYALSLGLDLEGAVPVGLPQFSDGNTLRGGTGIKLRVGEQIRLQGGLRFTPEVGYGYDHLFASDDVGNAYAWDVHRAFGGARLAFGRFLVPVIYAHVGYGWRSTGDTTVPDASGIAFDAGGALDLHIVPHLGFGAHVEYATIDAQPYTPQWVALGLHADSVF